MIGDDDCKYNFLTVLGTVQVTYVQRVSWKDCLVVADSLVRQYPFLKNPVNNIYITRISESVIELTPLFSLFMVKLHNYIPSPRISNALQRISKEHL